MYIYRSLGPTGTLLRKFTVPVSTCRKPVFILTESVLLNTTGYYYYVFNSRWSFLIYLCDFFLVQIIYLKRWSNIIAEDTQLTCRVSSTPMINNKFERIMCSSLKINEKYETGTCF